MNYTAYSFRRKVSSILLISSALFLSSCKGVQKAFYGATLQASIDAAKFTETGTSSIAYDPETGENVMVGTEWYILGLPPNYIEDNARANVGIYNETYDSVPRLSHTDDRGSLGIKVAIGYVGKGAKVGNTSLSMNDIEIPVDLVYHHPLGPGSIHGGLGPFFAYGVGGSFGNGESLYGADNGGFKRFDAGLNIMAGYTLNNGFYLDLGYDLGLANIEYASQDVKGYSRTFSINIGYEINRLFKKKK